MSSSDTRRLRRKMERDIKKGKLINYAGDRELYIPTQEEIEKYIEEKKNANNINKPIEDVQL